MTGVAIDGHQGSGPGFGSREGYVIEIFGCQYGAGLFVCIQHQGCVAQEKLTLRILAWAAGTDLFKTLDLQLGVQFEFYTLRTLWEYLVFPWIGITYVIAGIAQGSRNQSSSV
jgi:hypothetical protein